MSEPRCSRCGEEPRARGSSWGKVCLAGQARERRMRGGDATPGIDATDHATGDVAYPGDATPDATPGMSHSTGDVASSSYATRDATRDAGYATDHATPEKRSVVGPSTSGAYKSEEAPPGECQGCHDLRRDLAAANRKYGRQQGVLEEQSKMLRELALLVGVEDDGEIKTAVEALKDAFPGEFPPPTVPAPRNSRGRRHLLGPPPAKVNPAPVCAPFCVKLHVHKHP